MQCPTLRCRSASSCAAAFDDHNIKTAPIIRMIFTTERPPQRPTRQFLDSFETAINRSGPSVSAARHRSCPGFPVWQASATEANFIQVTGVGNIIDVAGLSFDKHAKVLYDPNTDLLSVTSGGVTDNLTVAAPHGATIALSSDGALGTDVTLIGIAYTGHV